MNRTQAKVLIITCSLLLAAAIVLFSETTPKSAIAVAVQRVSLTSTSDNCVIEISNKIESPALYDCRDPKSGRPQIELRFTTNNSWEEKSEWGSPFACLSKLSPHESKSAILDIEIPRSTRRFKIGIVDAGLTWRGRLGKYIGEKSSGRFLSELAFDLQYWDFERNLVVDWSQECSITNNSVICRTGPALKHDE